MPKPVGMGVAGLNNAFFMAGAGEKKCGVCYKLTGPLGSTVVMATDRCDSVDLCKQTDHAHFIISPADFEKIANKSSVTTIENLGYQEVACSHSDEIQVKFWPDKTGSYSYYFSVTLSSFNVGIMQVQVFVSNAYQVLTYVGGGRWNWNKSNAAMFSFPTTIRVVSKTGQVLTKNINTKPVLNTVSIGQFVPESVNAPAQCGMGLLPTTIFVDKLSPKWSDQSFDAVVSLNDSLSGKGNCIRAELKGYGGVKLHANAGFDPSTIQSFEFSAKSSVAANYIVSIDNPYAGNTSIGTEWTTYSFPMSSMSNKAREYGFQFQSTQGTPITLFLDELKFVYKTDVVDPPGVVEVPTVKPSPPPKVTTTGGTAGEVVSSSGSQDFTTSGQLSTSDLTGGKSDSSSATTLQSTFGIIVATVFIIVAVL
eukprot:gene16744-19908_t